MHIIQLMCNRHCNNYLGTCGVGLGGNSVVTLGPLSGIALCQRTLPTQGSASFLRGYLHPMPGPGSSSKTHPLALICRHATSRALHGNMCLFCGNYRTIHFSLCPIFQSPTGVGFQEFLQAIFCMQSSEPQNLFSKHTNLRLLMIFFNQTILSSIFY